MALLEKLTSISKTKRILVSKEFTTIQHHQANVLFTISINFQEAKNR